jgi:hypothetical protein
MEISRDKQIKQAAEFYAKKSIRDKGIAYLEFIEAAEWADATLIEKVCNKLRGQVYQEYPGGPLERLMTDEMIDEFIKTLKN